MDMRIDKNSADAISLSQDQYFSRVHFFAITVGTASHERYSLKKRKRRENQMKIRILFVSSQSMNLLPKKNQKDASKNSMRLFFLGNMRKITILLS